MNKFAQNIYSSRKKIISGINPEDLYDEDVVQEGGCGVVGFASSVPVGGRHIFEPSIQMQNRGNGKGGGIAAAGLVPSQLGVDAKTLRDDYILQIALLDSSAAGEVEQFTRGKVLCTERIVRCRWRKLRSFKDMWGEISGALPPFVRVWREAKSLC